MSDRSTVVVEWGQEFESERPDTCLPQPGRVSTLDGGDLPFSLRQLQPVIPGRANCAGFQVGRERLCLVRQQFSLVRRAQPVADYPGSQDFGPGRRRLGSPPELDQSLLLSAQVIAQLDQVGFVIGRGHGPIIPRPRARG